MNAAGYDVIGDVHGRADLLERLLGNMGYEQRGGAWVHPHGRVAVFVGDLIDRGAFQRETVELVRRMVDAGTALITMGNHEFNAVAYATPRHDRPGEFLRSHSDHHTDQHRAFLNAYGFGSSAHRDVIAWFRSLPMWLELDGLRVVHACWSEHHIDVLRRVCGGSDLRDDDALQLAGTKGTEAYDAIEILLKGPEVPLPYALAYHDKDGKLREKARYKWWESGPMTLTHRAVLVPDATDRNKLPHPGFGHEPVEAPPVAEPDHVPTIVGHYWFKDIPRPLTSTSACVDYSAVYSNTLVAYRWSGEPELHLDHFATSD